MRHNPEFLTDRLIYRDELILIIDKPAGLVVHARPGTAPGPEALEYYFDALKFGLPAAPSLAHRLDKDTSGCLVLGRQPKALRRLGKLFQEGKAHKTYWAICRGKPDKLSGTIRTPLIKKNSPRGWEIAPASPDTPKAQDAVTTYRTLKFNKGLSFIECRPKTGRTHQLRVHLASIGVPIMGDPKYGDLIATDRAHPMMLHARSLTLPLYPNKLPISAQAIPPRAMVDMLKFMDAYDDVD